MSARAVATLTIAIATGIACRTTPEPPASGSPGSPSTSLLGHWVLATPIDSTAFAGATRVELLLEPSSFTLTVSYPGRAPVTASGRLEQGHGGTLTFTPNAGETLAASLPSGQRLTRLATASGSALVLAPPSSSVPVPSSIWYRLEAARLAGLTP